MTVGVNVSVNGCLSLFVGPAIDFQLVQDDLLTMTGSLKQ